MRVRQAPRRALRLPIPLCAAQGAGADPSAIPWAELVVVFDADMQAKPHFLTKAGGTTRLTPPVVSLALKPHQSLSRGRALSSEPAQRSL